MIIKKHSYILIFTLTILSLVTILTHQLLRTVFVGTSFDKAMIDREHAEMIAFGGINIAISQLTIEKPTDKQSENKESKQNQNFKNFLTKILPNINRWQVFKLREEIDGVDGHLKICITCENGKININEIFDFKKQELKKEYKTLLAKIKFQKKENKADKFLKDLIELLKKRKRKIEDISELHTKAFAQIEHLFYEPPERTKRKNDAKPNEFLATQDIFTIWSENDKLEALFLSDSLCSILELRRPQAYDAKKFKEKYKEYIEKFKPDQDENTNEYWESLKPIYTQKNNFKIDDKKIFSSKFEPKVYSVLSSGKVGNVEQKVLAIIKKADESNSTTVNNKTEQKKNDNATKEKAQSFKIVRLYWI